ncbi:MAG TPA: DUF6064 family protein [Ramlibacter sp.]|nr:DUF6064 family protein [Ramlibacter sp.]
MTEWWTYGLSDFLMFSPQAYARLVARYNAAWWPGQGLGVVATASLFALISPRGGRAVLLLLALAWGWVGWAFHWQRYGEIFLGAGWLAGASALQALLLAGAAMLPGRRHEIAARRTPAAHALLALALLFPLLAPLMGRGWNEAEVFGFMPDPTALATLGALLAMAGLGTGPRTVLAVIPLLMALLGAATRWVFA